MGEPARGPRGLAGIELEAGRAGIHKARVLHGGRYQTRWQVVCSQCGQVEHKGFGPQVPPDAMVRYMRRAGWDVGAGVKPRCPGCLAGAIKESAVSQQPPSVGPAPRIARKVFGLLDEYFDEQTRRYRNGYSDERIAKEADTAIELVMRLRREAYGELAEDPKITELRDDMELLRLEVDDAVKGFNTRLGELRRRLDDLAKPRKMAG